MGPDKATDVKTPRLNPYLIGVVNIATRGMHAAALTPDNRVLSWSINDLGTLSRDTKCDAESRDGLNPLESTPSAVPSNKFPPKTKFVQVSAGDSCTFALTTEGLVHGWGTFRVNFHLLQTSPD